MVRAIIVVFASVLASVLPGCGSSDCIRPLLVMSAEGRLNAIVREAMADPNAKHGIYVLHLVCSEATDCVAVFWGTRGLEKDSGFVAICYDGRRLTAVRSGRVIDSDTGDQLFDRFEVKPLDRTMSQVNRLREAVRAVKALSPEYSVDGTGEHDQSIVIYACDAAGASVSSAYGPVQAIYDLGAGKSGSGKAVPARGEGLAPFAEVLYYILRWVKPTTLRTSDRLEDRVYE